MGAKGMKQNNMVAMILAGGRGSRLLDLTKKVAKPAVYFGGKYRDRKSTRLNSSHSGESRMPSSA